MDRTILHLVFIFIVGIILGVNHYQERLLGEESEPVHRMYASEVSSEEGLELQMSYKSEQLTRRGN